MGSSPEIIRVPDAVQRATVHRRAGTHSAAMIPDQQRTTPQVRRAVSAERNFSEENEGSRAARRRGWRRTAQRVDHMGAS